MKLLKLNIDCEGGFRSLQKGFELKFHTLEDTQAMEHFRPFCFAGLNGSGKSNVLEALANIFYHLELCVAKYLPDSLKDTKNFKRNVCIPDAFTLEYLIGQRNNEIKSTEEYFRVIINKKVGEEPGMVVFENRSSKSKKNEYSEYQIIPQITSSSETTQELINSSGKIMEHYDKVFLPDHVIGYSSGENEILSLPFIKSRLLHLDEYRQAIENEHLTYEEPENSLIYIDADMSQAVLLSCLLFENEKALESLRNVDNTGIIGMRSFRIKIQQQVFEDILTKNDGIKKQSPAVVTSILESHQIEKLKNCATSWFHDPNTKHLYLDFYVTNASKQAFKANFGTALECFQMFRLLYELNHHYLKEDVKSEVYKSVGRYTDWKLPVGTQDSNVFHFEDFYIRKELKGKNEEIDLLLRDFSDGEHQFIHSVGICLLMKNKRTLLLLDEPETHFNPKWRAKFIKILHDSINDSKGHEKKDFNIHLMKDILMTSHSPFIISDCLPDNVIFFWKTKKGKTKAKKVSEMKNSFNTFGTSVEYILDNLFDYRQSIGDMSNSYLENIKFKNLTDPKEIEKKKFELNEILGESIEKDLVIVRLNKKLSDKQGNA